MTQYSRFLSPLLWITVALVYVFAILPGGSPGFGQDKVNHVAAFLTLSVLGTLALPKRSLPSIWSALAIFGALIEFTQMIPALHREASLYDWLADICAATVGMLIAAPFRRRAQAAG